MISAIQKFVRRGGGLVTTHDAVGYRGHPSLITEVCAKGVAHVRDKQWIAVKEHPVTDGIELNKTMSHTYYDRIELKAGPNGTVLAKAPSSSRPVVIAGAAGKGRYGACGLLIGITAGNKSITPTGAEATLLLNAVKWCGPQRDNVNKK
jgi:hypothetical protein